MVVTGSGHDVELHRQVVAGVHFLEHRQRRHLRIAQVGFGVGAVDAAGERLFLVAVDPDALALLAEHQGGAGVLAHRQDAAGGDAGVLQQIERDEAVVRGCLRVVQDGAELRADGRGAAGGTHRGTPGKRARSAPPGRYGRTLRPSQTTVRTPPSGQLSSTGLVRGRAGTSARRRSRTDAGPGHPWQNSCGCRRPRQKSDRSALLGRRRNASRLTTCGGGKSAVADGLPAARSAAAARFARRFVLRAASGLRTEAHAEAHVRIGEGGHSAERDDQRDGTPPKDRPTLISPASSSIFRSQNWCCRTMVISCGYWARRRGGMTTPGWSVRKVR